MKISSLNNYQKRQISFWQLILYCVGGDLLQNALINGLFSNFAQIVYFPSDDCACVCFYAEHRCVSNDQRPSVALQNRDESGRKIDQNKSTPHLSLPHSQGLSVVAAAKSWTSKKQFECRHNTRRSKLFAVDPIVVWRSQIEVAQWNPAGLTLSIETVCFLAKQTFVNDSFVKICEKNSYQISGVLLPRNAPRLHQK